MKIAENAGSPLYAAAFLGDARFVVAGGGGQGAHGVANKAIVYELVAGKVEKLSELEFPPDSDSPTSMAATSDHKGVWVGVNVPRGLAGHEAAVDHLSKLEVSDSGKEVKLAAAYNHFKSNDIAIYQKSTSVAGNFVVSASSATPGTVTVFSSFDNDLVTIKFDNELVGAAVADYDENTQKFVAVASESTIDIRTISNPGSQFYKLDAPRGEKWSRIMAVGPAKFVAASTIGNRQGARLTIIDISSAGASTATTQDKPSVHTSSKRIPKFKGVTALASAGPRVAVASPGGDVYVYDCSCDPRLLCKLKGVHGFPVTSLAVSPDGESVVSTSLDGSLVLHTGLGGAGIFGATIAWVLLSAAIIALIAAVLSAYMHGTHHGAVEVYLRNAASSFRRGPAINPMVPDPSLTVRYHDSPYNAQPHSSTDPNSTEEISAVFGTAPYPTDELPESAAETLDAQPTPGEPNGESAQPIPTPSNEEIPPSGHTEL